MAEKFQVKTAVIIIGVFLGICAVFAIATILFMAFCCRDRTKRLEHSGGGDCDNQAWEGMEDYCHSSGQEGHKDFCDGPSDTGGGGGSCDG